MAIRLIHKGSGRALAERMEVAETLPARMRGLLGRSSLPAGEGMLIERCWSIHTFFMRFPLDIVFLDAGFVVRKIARRLPPWRIAMAFGARHVVELPAGTLERVPLRTGDRLVAEELT